MQRELTELLPWYDPGIKKRGRTSLAAFTPETAVALISEPGAEVPLVIS